jgi:hypothetical protein
MQLRSDGRFIELCARVVKLIKLSNDITEVNRVKMRLLMDVFNIMNKNAVFMMDCFCNKKHNYDFVISFITICDILSVQIVESLTINCLNDNNDRDDNKIDELMKLQELISVSKKKVVVHLRKIMKRKNAHLSFKNAEQVKVILNKNK